MKITTTNSVSATIGELDDLPTEFALVTECKSFARTALAESAQSIDSADEIPEELFDALIEIGLFASDEQYDHLRPHGGSVHLGMMMDALAALAEFSPVVAKAVMDQNFGQIGMLREFADEGYCHELISDIRSGRKQAAFAMTEPQGGSDPARFTTTAVPTDGGYLISGEKDWITGAARREVHFVVARSNDELQALGVFAVDRSDERNAASVGIGPRKQKLGLRGLGEHHVRYDNAFVPFGRTVLPPAPRNIGLIMSHYNVKRAGQAAICIGATRAAIRTAFAYGSVRFATSKEPHDNMRRTLAQYVGELKAAEKLLDWAVLRLGEGDRTGVPSAMVKIFASELAVKAISSAAQVCGANGLSQDLPIERLFRDVRMLTVAGGATDVVMKNVANRLHEYL